MTDAFLDDLVEFYKRKVSIPLVLFLDVAQWIDESTIQFLDSFLKEIKKRKLPVLILITHWIAEWNKLKEQDDQSNLMSICDRGPGKRFTGCPCCRITRTHFHENASLPLFPPLSKSKPDEAGRCVSETDWTQSTKRRRLNLRD